MNNDSDRDDRAKPRKDGPDFDPTAMRVLSHQLKSPLGAIQSLLKTVSEGFTGEINPKARHMIERAIGRASEAQELISDLLDFQAYSRQGASLKREELDVVDVLDPLIVRYTSEASERGLALQADLRPSSRIVMSGDRRALEHAFRNLLENAVKYTPEGGSVRVALAVSEEQKNVRVRVSDTGAGIREEELQKVFEPFYRSVLHKSGTPGTGLGLPIVRSIVSAHGGSIGVESREGSGTTFTVTLPYLRLLEREGEAAPRTKVVIIGGVTAGPKAAARLRRLDQDLKITVVERSELLSYSGCGLPRYISGKVRSPRALMSTADNTIRDVHYFEAIKDVTTLNHCRADRIDREHKQVGITDLKSGKTSLLPYDILVLAAGAEPVYPDIPGIDEPGVYSLYGIDQAESLKAALSEASPKDVLVLGGGYIGVGLCESLVEAGARVTIVEREPSILPNLMDPEMARKVRGELTRRGIKVITGVRPSAIERESRRLVVRTPDDAYQADLVILSTGVRPNAALAREAGLECGPSGGVRVDRFLRTSDESIYAVGDCAETVNVITGTHDTLPLGSVSTKMGRIAADNIAGREVEFLGFVGTSMFRAFETSAARTGLTCRRSAEAGFDPVSVVICGLDRSHYASGAETVSLKLIADRASRKILGAQGLGRGDVVSRIMILACAISRGITTGDLFRADLGYSPEFNSPIDVVQTAALALENKLDGLVSTISLEDFTAERDGLAVVDVSPPAEHAAGSIPGSVNVPLESVRREEVPFDKGERIVLYSRTSAGAYEAFTVLSPRGYSRLSVLEGGYLHWLE